MYSYWICVAMAILNSKTAKQNYTFSALAMIF
jgi:hypothetical protein